MRQGKSGPGLNSACPNPSPCWQWAIQKPPDTPARGAAEVSQTLPAYRIRECRRSPPFLRRRRPHRSQARFILRASGLIQSLPDSDCREDRRPPGSWCKPCHRVAHAWGSAALASPCCSIKANHRP